MKLYAKIRSERAEKSQGGNNFILLSLFVGSEKDNKNIGTLHLESINGGYSLKLATVKGEFKTLISFKEVEEY